MGGSATPARRAALRARVKTDDTPSPKQALRQIGSPHPSGYGGEELCPVPTLGPSETFRAEKLGWQDPKCPENSIL